MDEQPLVSVLMTSYKGERYIAQAIESVLASTYANIELIIVDDASGDNTESVVKPYVIKDQRVRFFINETNLSDYVNRSKAASFANGKYIKYLDFDDYIYPHSLSIMVEHMECNPDVAYAFCDRNIQDTLQPYPVKYLPHQAYSIHFLKGGLFYAGPGGMIFRNAFFKAEGGFNNMRFIGDTDLMMKLALKYPIIKIQPASAIMKVIYF